jgi:anti-sigma factor RsiW
MQFMRLFRRNRRWLRQVDAHVDGKLTPVERALLEERIEESPAVRQSLDETIALRKALRGLPEQQAPRSFAITEAMLAAPAPTPVKPPRTLPVVLRASQATAFASVALFGVLLVTDVSGQGGAATAPAANEASMTTMAGAEAAGEGGAQRLDPAAPESQDTGTTDDDTSDGAPPAGGGQPAQDSAFADTAVAQLTSAGESDERDYLPLYATLGGLLALAVAGWLVARRQLAYLRI